MTTSMEEKNKKKESKLKEIFKNSTLSAIYGVPYKVPGSDEISFYFDQKNSEPLLKEIDTLFEYPLFYEHDHESDRQPIDYIIIVKRFAAYLEKNKNLSESDLTLKFNSEEQAQKWHAFVKEMFKIDIKAVKQSKDSLTWEFNLSNTETEKIIAFAKEKEWPILFPNGFKPIIEAGEVGQLLSSYKYPLLSLQQAINAKSPKSQLEKHFASAIIKALTAFRDGIAPKNWSDLLDFFTRKEGALFFDKMVKDYAPDWQKPKLLKFTQELNQLISKNIISQLCHHIKKGELDEQTGSKPLYRIKFTTEKEAQYWLEFVAEILKNSKAPITISAKRGLSEEKDKAGVRKIKPSASESFKPYFRFSLTAENYNEFFRLLSFDREKFFKLATFALHQSGYRPLAMPKPSTPFSEPSIFQFYSSKRDSKIIKEQELFKRHLLVLKQFKTAISKYPQHPGDSQFVDLIIQSLTALDKKNSLPPLKVSVSKQEGIQTIEGIPQSDEIVVSNDPLERLNYLLGDNLFKSLKTTNFSSLVNHYCGKGIIDKKLENLLLDFQKEIIDTYPAHLNVSKHVTFSN